MWHFWRGSPELLAHVARLAAEVVSEDDAAQTKLLIDLQMGDDHEKFASPTQFLSEVTPEGLRHFSSIEITAEGDQLKAGVRLAWTRPWWKPGTSKDADVRLRVTGDDEERRNRAAEILRAAIKRGKTKGEVTQAVIGLALTYLFTAGLIAAFASFLFLLKVSADVIGLVSLIAGIVGVIAGTVFGTWAYPSLEVAKVGHGNFGRLIRFGGPLIVAFVLTGLAKLVYG